MALRKERVDVDFGQGIDQKTHPYKVVPGKLVDLVNGEINKAGIIEKRKGFTQLNNTILRYISQDDFASPQFGSAETAITDGEAVVAFDDELLHFESDHLTAWSPAENAWSYKSMATSVLCKSRILGRHGIDGNVARVQCAYTNGYRLICWHEGTSGSHVYYALEEVATGTEIVSRGKMEGISSQGVCLRAIAVGNTFEVLWTDGAATIRRARIDTDAIATGDFASATEQIGTNVDTLGYFDVYPRNSTTYWVVYGETSSGFLTIAEYSMTSTAAVASVTVGNAPTDSISVYFDGTLIWVAVAYDNTTNTLVYYTVYNTSLAQKQAPTTLRTLTTGQAVPQLTIGPGTGAGFRLVHYAFIDGATLWGASGTEVGQRTTLESRQISTSYNVSNPVQAIYNAHIVSNTWQQDGSTYLVVCNDSYIETDTDVAAGTGEDTPGDTLDTTYALLRFERINSEAEEPGYIIWPQVVGWWRSKTAFGRRSQNNPAGVRSDETTGVFLFGMAEKQSFIQDDDDDLPRTALDLSARPMIAQADFADFSRYATQIVDRTLAVGGGCVQSFDLAELYETDFPIRPVLYNNATGLPQGLAVAVFEWEDGLGNLYRSAPSQPTYIDRDAAFDVSTYTWTQKDVRVAVYYQHTDGIYYRKTVAVGGVNYLNPAAPAGQAAGAAVITCTPQLDVTGGAVGDANPEHESIYTTGNVIEHDPAPSCRDFTVWQNRLWLISAERPNEVWFSGEFVRDEGVWFSGLFRLAVGSELEECVAITAMDNWLVVHKERSIYVVQGTPPNALGQGNTLRERILPVDAGCKNTKSAVLAPKGIMFQSSSDGRVYTLTRGLTLEPTGVEVEDATSGGDVTIGLLNNLKHQVIFAVDGSEDLLIYHYLFNTWGKATVLECVDYGGLALWKGTDLCLLQTNGRIYWQDSTDVDLYDDNTTRIPMVIETGWIPIEKRQGYHRLYEIQLLMEHVDAHVLRVTTYYNYDDSTSVDAKIWLDTEIVPELAGTRSQLELRPSQQKLESLKLVIEELVSGEFIPPITFPSAGGGFKLSSIMLRVGLKPESFRLSPDTRK